MLCYDHTRQPRRLPYVTTLHGTDITLVGLDRSYLPITRFSIEQSDAVTAISNDLKQIHDRELCDHQADSRHLQLCELRSVPAR